MGDRLYGVGAFFAALSARGLFGLSRRHGRQSWRWLRGRKRRQSLEMLTNVLEPKQLSMRDALSLFPWRWKVERVFFDLK